MQRLGEGMVSDSVAYILRRAPRAPTIGIVLGSGLGDFVDDLKDRIEIPTKDIPHYPRSTVEGHKGLLVFASINGRQILAFQGRVHFYESNSIEAVLYPIRIAHLLGVKVILITNAAGAVNRSFAPGDLMVITDQMNLTNLHPTSNSHKERMGKPLYDSSLIKRALSIAEASGISVRSGVYVGLKGPSYETASEVEMIYRMGGDAVGMSTVLEVSLASQLGMDVLGISCITNLGTGIGANKLSHAEVTEVGNRVKKTFATLVSSAIAQI